MPLNAADIPPDFRMFAMFVGVYDSGKSTAAASFPGRKYFLDFDGRAVALRGRSDVDFTFYAPERQGFDDADKDIEMLVLKSNANQLPYNLVCLDSLSMGREFLVRDAMKFTSGIDPVTKKVSGRQIGKMFLPTVQDYGYEADAFKQIIWSGLKRLKCNVVVTAHSVDDYETFQANPGAPAERRLKGRKIYGDPQLLAVLPVAFTEIYEFFREENPAGKPRVRRFVEFSNGSIARTTYPQLADLGRVEITGKDFYAVWKEFVMGEKK